MVSKIGVALVDEDLVQKLFEAAIDQAKKSIHDA